MTEFRVMDVKIKEFRLFVPALKILTLLTVPA